jgi:hypothetical protein
VAVSRRVVGDTLVIAGLGSRFCSVASGIPAT